MQDYVAMAIGFAFGIAVCFSVVIGLHFSRRVFAKEWAEIPAIWIEGWRIGTELEEAIADRYVEFINATDGWEASGRLSKALGEAEASYLRDKQDILNAAELKLRALEGRATRIGHPELVRSLLEILSVDFPSIGLLSQMKA